MKKYVAEFSNGTTIERTSDRKYAFAWLVVSDSGYPQSGFAKDYQTAKKAADAEQSSIERHPSRGRHIQYLRKRGVVPGSPTGRKIKFREIVTVTAS